MNSGKTRLKFLENEVKIKKLIFEECRKVFVSFFQIEETPYQDEIDVKGFNQKSVAVPFIESEKLSMPSYRKMSSLKNLKQNEQNLNEIQVEEMNKPGIFTPVELQENNSFNFAPSPNRQTPVREESSGRSNEIRLN